MSHNGSPSRYTLRRPHSDELEEVVAFIYQQQANPATRCLHLDWHREGILADIQGLDVPFQDAFILALEGDKLVGVLGCDNDLEAGRAWLHGPFARAQGWHMIVASLFEAMWATLPPVIGRVSNYLELAYSQARDFHAQWGFLTKDVSHIYRAEAYSLTAPEGIHPFQPSDITFLEQAHTQAFPQTWLSVTDMIRQQDERHPILIAWHEGQPVGYARLSQHVALPEGTLDFVAVLPEWQGQGWGQRLIAAGLHWIFHTRQLPVAYLNVGDSNTQAKQLYERAGFVLYQSGVALDWFAPQAGESLCNPG
jgi:ribosomal protein S18 acetylase RimI-like enzyme